MTEQRLKTLRFQLYLRLLRRYAPRNDKGGVSLRAKRGNLI